MNEDEYKTCDYCGRETNDLNMFHDGSEICDGCFQCENYDSIEDE